MSRDRRIRLEFDFSTNDKGEELIDEIISWCQEHFGSKHRTRWGFTRLSMRSYFSDANLHYNTSTELYPKKITFYINHEEDAMALKLMWTQHG